MSNVDGLMRVLLAAVVIVLCAGLLFGHWVITGNPVSTFFPALLDEFTPGGDLAFESFVWLPPVQAMLDGVGNIIAGGVAGETADSMSALEAGPAGLFFVIMIDEDRMLLPILSMLSFGALLLIYDGVVKVLMMEDEGSYGFKTLEFLLRAVLDGLLYLVAVRLFIYVIQFPYAGGVSLLTLLLYWLPRLVDVFWLRALLVGVMFYGLEIFMGLALAVFLWKQRELLYFYIFQLMVVLTGVTFTPGRHVIFLILMFLLLQVYQAIDEGIVVDTFESFLGEDATDKVIAVVVTALFIAFVAGSAFGLCKLLGA